MRLVVSSAIASRGAWSALSSSRFMVIVFSRPWKNGDLRRLAHVRSQRRTRRRRTGAAAPLGHKPEVRAAETVQ